MADYKELGTRIGELVNNKQKVYGNSFGKCGPFLKLLYPDGISPDKYDDLLCIVRIFDKVMRIATEKNALNESPWADLVGYGLLGLMKDEKDKEKPVSSVASNLLINELCSVCQKKAKGQDENFIIDPLSNKDNLVLIHRECYEQRELPKVLEKLKNSRLLVNHQLTENNRYIIPASCTVQDNMISLARIRTEYQVNKPAELSDIVKEVGTFEFDKLLKDILYGKWSVTKPDNNDDGSQYLVIGECDLCKAKITEGVPLANFLARDKFVHEPCFQKNLEEMKALEQKQTEESIKKVVPPAPKTKLPGKFKEKL